MIGRRIGSALAVTAGAVVLSLAHPAAAASGNVVTNAGADLYVDIANCWSASGNSHVVDILPCAAANGYTTNKPNAMWFLAKGQSSASLGRFYTDTKAFKIRADCVLTMTTGTTFNRVGRPAIWIKTYTAEARVASYYCR